MAKFKEKILALQLRSTGTSINEIAHKLDVSKSTVSHWCRDITLSQRAIQRIVAHSKTKSTASLLAYTEGLREKRQKDILADKLNGKRRLGKLNERDVYCIGLGLYWGEGYKTGSQEFGFTNSDPRMIRFYIHWLETVFGVRKSDLILRVSINDSHKERVDAVLRYWSQVTKVPLSSFTQTSLIHSQSRKIYQNVTEHMGTLRIKVRRGTHARRQVLGAVEAVSASLL